MSAASDKTSTTHCSTGRDAVKSQRSITLVDNQVESRELFSCAREITIAHGDDVYRLRLTSQNKLILTK